MSSKIRGVHHCHLSPPSDIQEVASEQLLNMSLGARVRRPQEVKSVSLPGIGINECSFQQGAPIEVKENSYKNSQGFTRL